MRIKASNLNRRVTLQSSSDVQDSDTGKITKVWVDGEEIWANINPLSGRELMEAQKIQSKVTHRVKLRYYSSEDVTSNHRLKYNDRTFNISYVLNRDEANWEHELLCVENK